MKKVLSFLVAFIPIGFSPISNAKDLPKVAVWDLNPGNINPAYAQDLTLILISEMTKLKKYEVFSQENIRTVAG